MERLPSRLDRGRRNHTARLLANGSVGLRGGLGAGGAVLGDSELIGVASDAPASDPLRVEESIPRSGATGVAVDSIVAVRFSKPVLVTTVNLTSVSLKSADQEVKAKVVAAEAGMLAFVSPEAPLSPGTAYTLTLGGVSDGASALASTEITFTTNAEKAPQQAATAQPAAGGGPQREKEEILPPLQGPPGVTALAGQVLTTEGGKALPSVSLELNCGGTKKAVSSDNTGRFLLTGTPTGHCKLEIDGTSASRQGKAYGVSSPVWTSRRAKPMRCRTSSG